LPIPCKMVRPRQQITQAGRCRYVCGLKASIIEPCQPREGSAFCHAWSYLVQCHILCTHIPVKVHHHERRCRCLKRSKASVAILTVSHRRWPRTPHCHLAKLQRGHVPSTRKPATGEELERALQCGKFAVPPSELFLRVFHDSLMPLEHDPLMGCCSPSLLGSSGTCPLTIVSGLPDICRHMVSSSASPDHQLYHTDKAYSPI
jgi:hypothetical protein